MPRDPESPIVRVKRRSGETEAFCFSGLFPLEFLLDSERIHSAQQPNGAVIIVTPIGDRRLDPGDWAVRDPQGRLLICDNDTFHANFEVLR